MNANTNLRAHALNWSERQDALPAPAASEATFEARRALDAAMYCATLMALCARAPGLPREELALRALRVARHPELSAAVERAIYLALWQRELGRVESSDQVVVMLAIAVWAFVSRGHCAASAVLAAIGAGGHSDQAGALVAGWIAVLHDGGQGLPVPEKAA